VYVNINISTPRRIRAVRVMQNANIVPSSRYPATHARISKDAEFQGIKGRRRRESGEGGGRRKKKRTGVSRSSRASRAALFTSFIRISVVDYSRLSINICRPWSWSGFGRQRKASSSSSSSSFSARFFRSMIVRDDRGSSRRLVCATITKKRAKSAE